ncbi:RagB/SusD family nutrient uptake outer membrane protein [uncultured Chitinophaga sp.]|uniref:RagB/SusD family nutrient uptake outer membrane protein n=1 Tax=uncultured Chitinophaga sp. TaxID=339340 RepID=UPI0025CDBE9B|nr:RagB/SusD family nutrient uptake outer membrane protein [uncultured Chitinophaga sp.]
MILSNNSLKYIGAIALLLAAAACTKFVDVPLPINQIPNAAAFADDGKAQSSMRGIYAATQNGFGNGPFSGGLTTLLGLSSDEFTKATYSADEQLFFDNNLSASTGPVSSAIWAPMYASLYMINNLYENVEKSKGVSAKIKDELMGEAKFLRALHNFYLVNLYDSLPLAVSSNYQVNALLPRTAPEKAWELINSDLTFAIEKMNTAYTERGYRYRANRYAAYALMARTQLYQQNWIKAEENASNVINAGPYRLENLDSTFNIRSREAILQLANAGTNLYALEAGKTTGGGAVATYRLSSYTKDAFEPNDLRWTKWVKIGTDGFAGHGKYKVFSNTNPLLTAEATNILRLGEQYLIRAEARAMQDNLTGAIADVDSIRARAGLPLISNTNPGISKENLLLAIEKERQTELFGELGHRWLDVKRRGLADVIFGARKPKWRKEAALFPIPFYDRQNNPYLGQNPGYE